MDGGIFNWNLDLKGINFWSTLRVFKLIQDGMKQFLPAALGRNEDMTDFMEIGHQTPAPALCNVSKCLEFR